MLEVSEEPHLGCGKFIAALRRRRDEVRQLDAGPRAAPARARHPRPRERRDPAGRPGRETLQIARSPRRMTLALRRLRSPRLTLAATTRLGRRPTRLGAGRPSRPCSTPTIAPGRCRSRSRSPTTLSGARSTTSRNAPPSPPGCGGFVAARRWRCASTATTTTGRSSPGSQLLGRIDVLDRRPGSRRPRRAAVEVRPVQVRPAPRARLRLTVERAVQWRAADSGR